MQLNKKTIQRIIRENKKAFEMLEEYDRTKELSFNRRRIDVTLSVEALNKIRKLKEKTGKPISQIIEEKI